MGTTIEPQHFAVDLETIGTIPGSVITDIAFVAFDPRTETTGAEFTISIEIDDSVKHGLKLTVATLIWWLGQSDEARNTLTANQTNAWTLKNALKALNKYLEQF